jgi:teichuronic acid exporter
MAWSVTERLSLQVIHMVISIILARLLEPSQFGLIGMLAIFTSIAQSISDSGFGSALIQKKDATETDSSSIFYFNLLIGIFLFGILFVFAPYIAKFFNQPILTSLTRVLSLTLIINAFSLVQLSLLKKNLDFKKHFTVSIFAVLFSGVGGIIAAYAGLGVWSLVVQSLTFSLAQVALLWFLSKWRPTLEFSYQSLRSMYSFGSRLFIAGIIETIFKNVYQTFIGKTYSAADLGYYSRAQTMESAVSVAGSMALGQVIFSSFSPYQDQNDTLKKVHSKAIRLSTFIILPIMIGLIVIAKPLFLFLLTEKWAPSVPYFQLLCTIGVLFPMVVQNYNMLRIKGRSDYHLRLEVFKYSMTAIAILLTYKHGILALIYGQIAVAYISHIAASYFAGKLVDYSLRDQFMDILMPVFASLVMGIVVFLIGKLNIEIIFIRLIVQVFMGILTYYLVNKIMKSPDLEEVLSILKHFFASLTLKIKGILWKNR